MHSKKFRNSFELGYNFIAKIGDKKNGFLNFGIYVFNKEKILQGINKNMFIEVKYNYGVV